MSARRSMGTRRLAHRLDYYEMADDKNTAAGRRWWKRRVAKRERRAARIEARS